MIPSREARADRSTRDELALCLRPADQKYLPHMAGHTPERTARSLLLAFPLARTDQQPPRPQQSFLTLLAISGIPSLAERRLSPRAQFLLAPGQWEVDIMTLASLLFLPHLPDLASGITCGMTHIRFYWTWEGSEANFPSIPMMDRSI